MRPAAGPEFGRPGVLATAGALAAVAVLLALLAAVRNSAESTAAGIAGLLPVGWAFAAGMVASVNPCGFFMLPAYLSYHLSGGSAAAEAAPGLPRVLRAVLLGLAATTGFVVVMTAAGVVIGAAGQQLVRAFPYAGLAIGAALTALGLWLLVSGRTVGVAAASRLTVAPQRGLANVFLFGIAYAVGSLSCTLPVFLLVAGSALTAGSLLGSLGQFVSFGLGMGMVLIAVTVGAVLFRDAVTRSLRRVLPHVQRTSALFLVGAGLYLMYYWVVLSGFIL